jgi:hypothetical protein
MHVGVPFVILFIVQLFSLSSLSNAFGMDIIQERNECVSLKTSMKTTLSNLALVSALLLGTVLGMLQSRSGDTLEAKWYGLILVMSVCFNLIAVIEAVLGTLYIVSPRPRILNPQQQPHGPFCPKILRAEP